MSKLDIKDEILRRAKLAAVAHGKNLGKNHAEFPTYSLRLTGPHLGTLTIFWVPHIGNLRIRLTIQEFGYNNSKSIVDFHEIKGKRPERVFWHYTERNNQILAELRRHMVLDDMADV